MPRYASLRCLIRPSALVVAVSFRACSSLRYALKHFPANYCSPKITILALAVATGKIGDRVPATKATFCWPATR
jgi:hypothetical protein